MSSAATAERSAPHFSAIPEAQRRVITGWPRGQRRVGRRAEEFVIDLRAGLVPRVLAWVAQMSKAVAQPWRVDRASSVNFRSCEKATMSART